MVRARLSNFIYIDVRELPDGVLEEIKNFLTITNQEKVRAIKRGDWGADDLPDVFYTWIQKGDVIAIPRGFHDTLVGGLERQGVGITWDDQTMSPSVNIFDLAALKVPTLKDEQIPLVASAMEHRHATIVAAPGKGKTVMGLDVWRRSGLRGLIAVEKGSLMRQWAARSREHLGYEPGIIGDDKWDERDLTIVMLQTLFSRLDQIPDEWFKQWGILQIDEAHHAVAQTYSKVLYRFSPYKILGWTATPLDGDWRKPFLEQVVGPVVARADKHDLDPKIVLVETGYKWIPKGKDVDLKKSTTIWQRTIKDLATSESRAMTVAHKIVEQPSSCSQLVISRNLDHLDLIKRQLEELGYGWTSEHPGDILMLRGKETLNERESVAVRAASGSCVTLATAGVAGEGLDIPRLDRGHLVWPQKAQLGLIQQCGRFLRDSKDKLPPVIFDYVDDQPVLREQARKRMRIYRQQGWEVSADAC